MFTKKGALMCIVFCISLPLVGASIIDTVPLTQKVGMVSNSWNDFMSASPSEQIPLIDIPSPNSSGNAHVNFPIKLPDGRLGLTPIVNITYNNEGSSTWLGNDWDLNFSSFILDTRWGVPLFDQTKESEIYLFDGEQLGPVFHRLSPMDREEDRHFHLRQEGSFQKIIRHGTGPENYWWEVREKNGTKHYYGGHPSIGTSTDHILSTKNGNITEWHIHETRDIHGNFIKYHYQKRSVKNGQNIYPSQITYNGFGDKEGNYAVDFVLTEGSDIRTDVSINGRTGMFKTIGDLLKKIEITHNDQVIRRYELDYETGVFEKTLLNSIAEYDADNEFFYEYRFNYYDDVTSNGKFEAFTAARSWNVPKDNISLGSISSNLPLFNAKPTLLGGASTESKGGGLAVTVGPPFNPASKANSAGPNSSLTDNKSEGLSAFIDINGDGLPDKVWKESGGLYFRPNLHTPDNPIEGFGIRQKIEGINAFSAASTFAWTIGAEVNIIPFFAGYFHEESTTTISTYFADFNGDELIDIVHNGQVYFNHLSSTGIPTFSRNSAETPSIIYKGEDLPMDPFDPDAQRKLEEQFPLHDVVRVWRAPRSGIISIDGDVQLIEDLSPEAQSYDLKDGVRVSIQKNDFEIWNSIISENSFNPITPSSVNSINVSEGDKLYFRVHSIEDGAFDKVFWDPTITYLNSDPEEVNAQCLPINVFHASEDFLVSGNGLISMPQSGVIEVNCELNKPVLTDSIYLVVEGVLDTIIGLDAKETLNNALVIGDVKVVSGDELRFYIDSKSNVNWTNIEWRPIITYSAFDDGSDVLDQSGNPVISICPEVEYRGYFKEDFLAKPFVAPEDGTLSCLHKMSTILGFSTEDYHVAYKIKGQTDTTFVFNGKIDGNAPEGNQLIELLSGDSLFVDFYADDEEGRLFVSTFETQFNSVKTIVEYGTSLRDLETTRPEGHLYRGWGQFIYNPIGDFPLSPMNFNELDVDTTGLAGDTVLVDPDVTNGGLEGSNVDIANKFIVMTSDLKNLAWRGSDDLTYLNSHYISSTRYGRRNISPGNQISQGDWFSSPDLIIKTKGDGGIGGLGVGPAEGSAGYTGITTWTVKDIGDMNGDRYPDIIDENKITYTNAKGGLSLKSIVHNFGTHEVFSEAVVFGAGRDPANSGAKNAGGSPGKGSNKSIAKVRQKGKSNLSKAKSASKSARGSIGISGGLSNDEDKAKHTFLDVNGDGLEDKIFENGDVALSLGYSFAPIVNWGFSGLSGGNAQDLGGGLGYTTGNGSWTAGVSVSRTNNQSEYGFLDVNDDALLDQIVGVHPLRVRINTGSGFTNEMVWIDEEFLDEGVSIGESANGAFTFCLEFLFFRICFNPSVYTGQGTSAIYTAFQDVNGDGYIDFCRSTDDDSNLDVKYNKTGRTNFLKSIETPLGGTISLDYKFEGNTTKVPFSKWVLAEVNIEDGLEGDGVNAYHRTFSYENGYYDRHERQFYGFQTVKEFHMASNKIARTIAREYHNQDYYLKGKLKEERILGSDDELIKSITSDYYLIDIHTGLILPNSYQDRDDGVAFAALGRKTLTQYEGEDLGLSQILTYEYDSLGNVVSLIDQDEAGSTQVTSFKYNYDDVNYLMDKVEEETIEGNGRVYRVTKKEYDGLGNLVKESRKIDENTFAIVEKEFDSYGNIIALKNPENYKGQRLKYEYVYDSVEHQFLIQEKDSYGYVMKYEHDLKFQTLTRFIDQNGNSTEYLHDNKGRTTSIIYPHEAKYEIEHSIRIEYFINEVVPYAIAHHYDPEYDDDLSNYTFEDGLHRKVQSKRRSEVYKNTNEVEDGYVVSGHEYYDELGRVSARFLPSSHGLSEPMAYTNYNDTVSYEKIVYDALDRPIEIIDAFGQKSTIDYGIESNNLGETLLTTTEKDPLGFSNTKYYNARGFLVSIRYDGPEGDVWTHYRYDGFNQMVEILDHNHNTTFYAYDLLGRRVYVNVPDAGETHLTYDAANNLIERETAKIREEIPNKGAIQYTYDYERLVQIDYPKNFQNRVQIHYGSPQDSFNRVGRIWLQEDATGGREYFFDANGNVIKTIRTIMINRSNVFTYVFESDFDGWNRCTKMIYPDGEEVSFGYNRGGQLKSIEGKKGKHVQTYLKAAYYDKFLDRRKVVFGNDTEMKYEYDNKGRLSSIATKMDDNSLTVSETIAYDAVDNVVNRTVGTIGKVGMGGESVEEFVYDPLRRLSSSKGVWNGDYTKNYSLFYDYDNINNVTMKSQNVLIDNERDELMSRTFDFEYQNEASPTRPNEVGGKQFTYDANGNLLLSNSQAIFTYDQNVFDEENRLIGSSNNGYISRYSYDGFGIRTLKSHGGNQGVFINGSPSGFIEHKENFQVEVSPYFTIYKNEYRKHFYIDDIRLLTKIGTGVFQTNLSAVPEITAGGIDYKKRIQSYEQSILEYYGTLGIPPGPPTLLAFNGQPEINETGLPSSSHNNPFFTKPNNWPNIGPPDTLGPPGPPVFYEFADINNENVSAGYNFTMGNLTKEIEQFYYHYDHTNSVHYCTDFSGKPRQYAAYLPSGERWLAQTSSKDLSNYYFRGMALDEETGYYNLGNVYYDPTCNLEQSLDPILQNFGELTFERRLEGNFYYDYADFESEVVLDDEIINSERPDPFLSNAINHPHRDGKKNEFPNKNSEFKVGTNKPSSKNNLNKELNSLIDAFNNQDKDNPESFYYKDFSSFFKYQKEIEKAKKRTNKRKVKRKLKTQNPRKVRFK